MAISVPGRYRLQYPSTDIAEPNFQLGSVTVAASSSVTTANSTAAINGATQYSYTGARGLSLFWNISSGPTSGTGVPTIRLQYQDELSTNWITGTTDISMTATTSPAQYQLTIYPGVTVATSRAVSQPIPSAWRTQIDVSSSLTGQMGYSVSCRYLP